MNVKAIAGYLNTAVNQIVKCDEWANVYFVIVDGFKPVFVSKKAVSKFIAADKLKFNAGLFTHFTDAIGYGKAYGSRPLYLSPAAKKVVAKIESFQAPATGVASLFFPAA